MFFEGIRKMTYTGKDNMQYVEQNANRDGVLFIFTPNEGVGIIRRKAPGAVLGGLTPDRED
jgi:hypothetical protein